jgi:prevent-host-death family protein
MNTWPVQDAKARFSEMLDACLKDGPQLVTRRGTEAAMLVSVAEWKRLTAEARPSLKALLMSDIGRTELNIPARGQATRRATAEL